VSFDARIDRRVVGVRRLHELHAAQPQRFDAAIDVGRRERDVLDAFAVIRLEILFHLRVGIARLVDGYADLSARAHQRARAQARLLTVNVEVTDLPETEELLVELRPVVHATLVDVMRDVIYVRQPRRALRPWSASRRKGGFGGKPLVSLCSFTGLVFDDIEDEVHVVYRAAFPISVDQIERAAADAADGRDVELHRPDFIAMWLRSEVERAFVRMRCVFHADRERADRRAVDARERLREAVRLVIQDEVDVALAVEDDVFGAVPRNERKTHRLEEPGQGTRIRRRVFDELESVGACRVTTRSVHTLTPLAFSYEQRET
jgi:hypothetical protein